MVPCAWNLDSNLAVPLRIAQAFRPPPLREVSLPRARLALHGMRDAASGLSFTLPPAALAAARPRELGACRCPPRARRPRMYRFCVCAGMGVSDVAAGGIRCSCG